MLDIKSESKGLLISRMNSTERTRIALPTNGLLVFETRTNLFWFYSIFWKELVSDTKFEVE